MVADVINRAVIDPNLMAKYTEVKLERDDLQEKCEI